MNQSAFADDTATHATIDSHPLSKPGQISLARDFVKRISAGFKRANEQMGMNTPGNNDVSNLADGEVLLFQVRITKKLHLDTPLMGEVRNGQVMLSFRDFINILEFPIDFDGETGKATGWYIRQNKTFNLDLASRSVQTDKGTFSLPQTMVLEENDLFVTASQLQSWFGIKVEPIASNLDLFVESTPPLPILERIERKNFKSSDNRVAPPSLPRMPENRQAIDFPFIDVATTSSYRKEGRNNNTTNNHQASVMTSGDFAYGTLTTQSQLNDQDKLSNFRANYKRESDKAELLGPLKARRYELGDLTTARLPIGNTNLEQGTRITNTNAVRNYLQPSTDIIGTIFPGWDVELYRDNQLLSVQSAGDDGTYRFTNVDLFSSDNNFRVVMYGPQGETREETIYIPVDNERLSSAEGVYDVSLTRQETQTYSKRDFDDEDKGTAHLTALYEKPINQKTAVIAGLDSREREGERISTLQAGVSTTLAQTLLNLNTAIDNNSETAVELTARRDFGKHRLRNELGIYSEGYDVDKNDFGRETFQNTFGIEGPLPFLDQENTKTTYNMTANYSQLASDGTATNLNAGINTYLNNIALGQSFNYSNIKADNGFSHDSLHSVTTATGTLHGYRLRLLTDYEMKPDSNLDRVTLGLQKRVSPDVETGFDLEHRMEPRLTTASTYVNWDTGYGRLSPSLSYNSDNDVTAMMNTRFGIARDPQSGKIRSFDTHNSYSGGVSAFVYLDKNGDSLFNEGDEPLPDVTVAAPHNGGRMATDEEGYAFFRRMQPMRLTDVYIEQDSLQDPAWVPGYEGASTLPREGYVTALQFPIHISGEIDGTVYASEGDGGRQALRGTTLTLYNIKNGKTSTTTTESDGFYVFSQIPPGDYYLNVEAASLSRKDVLQPPPQKISIGYNGTMMYSNDIILQAGHSNVPIAFIKDAHEITADADILANSTVLINLGSYKSRMLMGLHWFKIRSTFPSLFRNARMVEKPSESFAALKTGKHALRIIAENNDLIAARELCLQLTSRKINCGVEIITNTPQKLAQADKL